VKVKFQVVAERCDGGWALTFPGYPGAYSQGESESEVIFMAKDLIHEMLDLPLEQIELEIRYLPEDVLAL
jgi:predicted RNase H-like HicB family nuclease